jgi:hypothetical protein
MSKIVRFFCVAVGLVAMFFLLPAAPAHATFNATCSITANGLPTIRLQPDSDGGVTFYVETVNGDGRFFEMRPAGGHWEIHSMHDLPDGSALDLDANGYPVVIQD